MGDDCQTSLCLNNARLPILNLMELLIRLLFIHCQENTIGFKCQHGPHEVVPQYGAFVESEDADTFATVHSFQNTSGFKR